MVKDQLSVTWKGKVKRREIKEESWLLRKNQGLKKDLFGFSSNYKTSPAPRWEGSSELPVVAVTLVFIKVSLATGKHRHSQMLGICLAPRVTCCFKTANETQNEAGAHQDLSFFQQHRDVGGWLVPAVPVAGRGEARRGSELLSSSQVIAASCSSLGNIHEGSVTPHSFIHGGGQRTGQVTELRCVTGTG